MASSFLFFPGGGVRSETLDTFKRAPWALVKQAFNIISETWAEGRVSLYQSCNFEEQRSLRPVCKPMRTTQSVLLGNT